MRTPNKSFPAYGRYIFQELTRAVHMEEVERWLPATWYLVDGNMSRNVVIS